MERVKRTILCLITFSFLMFSVLVGVIPKGVCYATDSVGNILRKDFDTSEESLLQYGLTSANVSNVSPFNSSLGTLMGGNSISPTMTEGSGTSKYFVLNIETQIDSYEIDSTKLGQLYLDFWIYFDQTVSVITTSSIQISLYDDNENSVSWDLTNQILEDLISRDDCSEYDLTAFGQKALVPVGWCEFKLPFSSALTNGTILETNSLVFENLKISQSGALSQKQLLFYDIFLNVDSSITETTCLILDYINFNLRTQNFVDTTETYYTGELFPKFKSISAVFNTCYVGNTNLLNNTSAFVIKVVNMLGESTDYSYGSHIFVLNSDEYSISYGINYNGRFISVNTDMIRVSTYGNAVWIDSAKSEIEVGDTYKLYYKVHKAFGNATINFSSSDENVLSVIEVNRTNNYIVVEAKKAGTAKISISVTDDRLIGSQYEESGIINDGFQLKISKPSTRLNTTIVLLWVALGALVATAIFFVVKGIKESKNIQIK